MLSLISMPQFFTMKRILLTTVVSLFFVSAIAQNYWQQRVEYTMDIQMDVVNNQFKGDQKLVYTNNSPDTLHKVYFHLYFNAFQPGSMMDARSRSIADPDRRVSNRIKGLKDDEIGYQKVTSLKQDGKDIEYETSGTILEVKLDQPILPGASTTLEMLYDAQVPIQIRRSGRDNREGIRFSMTQWYPKLVEYDHQGWHPNPYIGREFHGVWGDFDVSIHIDQSYMLGATGYLQNADEMGYGGEGIDPASVEEVSMKTWRFVAPMVHDFAWVADPDFTHTTTVLDNGTVLHFLYQKDSTTAYWDSLPAYAKKTFEYMNANFGEYPYMQYTVAQGGDGGMEYPMITLITGKRSLRSLVGVTVHEALHSWYQHLLGTNEAQYAWMDEGFTTYASDLTMQEIWPGYKPFRGSYSSYFRLVESGKQEPLTTHADHFNTNVAYGVAAYSMGCIFLHQLSYVIGQDNLMHGMRRYFNEWNQKHPTPNDFIRIMEKVSDMELGWYLEQWVETTNTIDYGIKMVQANEKQTSIRLENLGRMPMPIDLAVELNNGDVKYYNIPLRIMRGNKEAEEGMDDYTVLEDWPWTFPEYQFNIDVELEDIKSIEIDPSRRMADIDRSNNVYPPESDLIFESK